VRLERCTTYLYLDCPMVGVEPGWVHNLYGAYVNVGSGHGIITLAAVLGPIGCMKPGVTLAVALWEAIQLIYDPNVLHSCCHLDAALVFNVCQIGIQVAE